MEASAEDRRTGGRWAASSPARKTPSPAPPWEPVTRVPRLRPGEVHVIRASLDPEDRKLDGIRTLLTGPELEQVAAVDGDAARRTLLGRGLLRTLLGGYLGVEPGRVPLASGTGGKPILDGITPPASLHFNHARSGGTGVYAFTRVGPVGVDLERVRTVPDPDGRTEKFSSTECATLERLPPGLRNEGFFQCWTRKEALLKATGGDLPCSLQDFDVSLTPGVPARVYRWRNTSCAPGEWTLLHLRPEPGFVGAVAVRGLSEGLKTWSWEGSPV